MEITIEQVLSVFKNTTEEKRLKDIKTGVLAQVQQEKEQSLFDEDTADIERQIEQLLREDRKREEESYLRYQKGKYKKRPNKTAPKDPTKPTTVYTGTAGETAVISELMFNGYNANRMMIDEGIDIVATKNNIYYYIQVKTTYVEKGRIYCQIPIDRYDIHIQNNLKYIIVARYNDNGTDRNMFFVFSQQKIDEGIYGRYIKKGENNISIKIKFHAQSGKPYLYDEKESDISFNLNNFKLI